jgi:hypothetical protein
MHHFIVLPMSPYGCYLSSLSIHPRGRGDLIHTSPLRVSAIVPYFRNGSMFIPLELDQHSRLSSLGYVLLVGTALLIEPNLKVLGKVGDRL